MSKTVEEWKDIEGYDGKYQVSDWGRVRDVNYRNKGIIKLRKLITNNGGYKTLRITKNGVIKHYFVHRLVWETFKGEIPEGLQVNHIDENKANNHLENLNLLSQQENNNWGTRNQRISLYKLNYHPRAVKVAQYTKDLELVKVYPSARRAELDGFCHKHIIKVCKGICNQYKGYIWRYVQ